MASFLSSTIGRKYAMALSAFFLLIFLIIHLFVNMLSLFGEDAYNSAAYFMGYNPLVQYALQPVLVVGIIFHFVMGFVLEYKNNKSRPIKYAVNGAAANSTWMSRNMLITGAVILAFLVEHYYQFWIHEMAYKYIPGDGDPNNLTRFYGELHEKFADLWRVIFYVISFILLGLHLSHGFQSSFQSVGARHPKYLKSVRATGLWYSILIPLGFIIVAIYHYVTQ